MKESSSRFVDQLTLEKLLSEKLEKVHHFPKTGLHFDDSLFSDWEQYQQRVKLQLPTALTNQRPDNVVLFDSLVAGKYTENQKIRIHSFLTPDAKANLVFYHGLFEENRGIYQFLFSNLNRVGINVYLCTLPFHYERKPSVSAFSGEFFWSAYFERTRNAFKQAIYDFHQVKEWVAQKSTLPVLCGGFSMGGAVALIYGALHKLEAGIIALNPAVSLSKIVWDSPLCRTIKKDYQSAGYQISQLQKAYADFEPISYQCPQTPVDKIFLGYGSYDLVTSPALYESFLNDWHLQHTKEYKSGHLNLLRVPRVANDLFQFWQNNDNS